MARTPSAHVVEAGRHRSAGPGGDGVCGANCDGFCQIAAMYCTGANQVYTDAPDCQATCAAAKTDAKFAVSPEPGVDSLVGPAAVRAAGSRI